MGFDDLEFRIWSSWLQDSGWGPKTPNPKPAPQANIAQARRRKRSAVVCVVPDAADLFALPKPEIGNTRGKLYTLNRFGSGVWVNGLGFGVQDLGWVQGLACTGL